VIRNPLRLAPESLYPLPPFDLLRKKGDMMQKAIVGQGKTQMDKMEKESVTLRSSFKAVAWKVSRSWCGLMSMERKKSDEEAEKKRSRGTL
jgi:hypothetical protein